MELKLASNIDNLEPSATEEVDNAVKRMKRAGIKDIISFGVGEPCFDTPVLIREAAKRALDAGDTRYQATTGSYELREEIVKKLKAENGIDVTVEDVAVTPGAKFSLFLFFMSVIEKGDEVILFTPAWVSYDAIVKMMGGVVVNIPTKASNGFEPDPDEVVSHFTNKTKVIVMNSPCNPTGAVYSKETVKRITREAQKRGIFVISDEIYEKLIFDGAPYSPASEFDNVVTVNGFSKTYAMTGWRLGYIVANPGIMEGMVKIYQHSASCVTAFAQAGAIEALRNPQVAEDVNEMVKAFARKRQLMVDRINKSQYFDCLPPKGAFYTFPHFHSDKTSVEIAADLLEKAHVAVLPGSAFGACGEGYLRFSYATSDEAIEEGFDRIEQYFKAL